MKPSIVNNLFQQRSIRQETSQQASPNLKLGGDMSFLFQHDIQADDLRIPWAWAEMIFSSLKLIQEAWDWVAAPAGVGTRSCATLATAHILQGSET